MELNQKNRKDSVMSGTLSCILNIIGWGMIGIGNLMLNHINHAEFDIGNFWLKLPALLLGGLAVEGIGVLMFPVALAIGMVGISYGRQSNYQSKKGMALSIIGVAASAISFIVALIPIIKWISLAYGL